MRIDLPWKRNVRHTQRALAQGMALALAELHRKTNASSAVLEVAREASLTLDELRAAGVSDYDLEELKRAGLQ